MSRIGKKPVTVPGGVTATVNGQEITVKGPKGELKHVLADAIVAKLDKGDIEVAMREDTKDARAMWGMSRTMVANLVAGVTEGFTKKLEITGVGYRAAVQGSNLQLQLGYSHDVSYPDPARHPGGVPEADRDRRDRHRQAEGRPGRGRDQAVQAAGAL